MLPKHWFVPTAKLAGFISILAAVLFIGFPTSNAGERVDPSSET